MTGSKRGGRYPAELRERAVRMLFEHQHEYPSQWQAIKSIAEELSIHRETMRTWVRRAEVDAGRRPGLTSDQLEELKLLRRENAELRRANDILKAASAFFGAELDRHSRK
jgi:transposase